MKLKSAIHLTTLAFALAPGCSIGTAEEPKKKPLSTIEALWLEHQVRQQDEKANKLYVDGRYDEAIATFKKSLETRRRIMPKEKLPDGNELLAIGLSNVKLHHWA